MLVDSAKIERLISENIPDVTVRMSDLRGDGEHFSAYILSPAFAGKTRIEQHQMVYKALESLMEDELHALAIQTAVPEE